MFARIFAFLGLFVALVGRAATVDRTGTDYSLRRGFS